LTERRFSRSFNGKTAGGESAVADLEQRLQSLEQLVKNRKTKEPPPKRKGGDVVQLPLWPEPARGVPNSTLRGALFAAVQGKGRQALKREVLAAQNGITIRFTGWQLDQSDLDVWEQCLHLARMHPLGTRCDFTANAFLKALGRKTGKSQHEQLKDNFARLTGCAVEITHNNLTYGGGLMEFYRDEHTQRYRLEVNPKLKALFDAGWTAIDWQQRHQLARKPLALWLHGFYASHADPFPLKVETLYRLSGSTEKRLRDFKRRLRAALEDLQATCAITAYEIEGDLVTVYRTPSDSQRRHLDKPKPRRK
jgi:hypothetical protein